MAEMSKCLLADLLKKEVKNLNNLIESLEDKSKLCCPSEYNCTKCLNKIVCNLRRIEKDMRKEVYRIKMDSNILFLNEVF